MKIFSKFPTVNISKLNFWLVICIAKNFIWTTLKMIFSIFRFFAPSDSRFTNSCISDKYCPIITNHTSMESYLFSFQMLYTSQFQKIDPYDWFCGSNVNSKTYHKLQFWTFTLKLHSYVLWNPIRITFLKIHFSLTAQIGFCVAFSHFYSHHMWFVKKHTERLCNNTTLVLQSATRAENEYIMLVYTHLCLETSRTTAAQNKHITFSDTAS